MFTLSYCQYDSIPVYMYMYRVPTQLSRTSLFSTCRMQLGLAKAWGGHGALNLSPGPSQMFWYS